MLEEKETPVQTSALPIYMCIVSILGSSAGCRINTRHAKILSQYKALEISLCVELTNTYLSEHDMDCE